MNYRKFGAQCAVVAGVVFALFAVASADAAAPEYQHLRLTASIYRDPFSDLNRVDGPKEFMRGEKVFLTVKGELDEGFHTYPLLARNLNTGQVPSIVVRFLDPNVFSVVGEPNESPAPELVKEETGEILREHRKPFQWTWEIQINPNAPAGELILNMQISGDVCNNNNCFKEYHSLSIPLTNPTGNQSVSSTFSNRPPQSLNANALSHDDSTSAASDFDLMSYYIEFVGIGAAQSGLWASIVAALVAGLVSLLTPCVFPMIPITVSYFIKQGEKKHHSTLTLASVYCGTIVAVMTAGGVALGSVLQAVTQHAVTNIILAGVFIFFGLSLLGMYEIMLPSGLSDATAKRQGKGGLMGVVFMALTFSIISFACVGPIFGGFITLQSSDAASATGWLRRILAPLAFAVAFAFPFFILAIFPSLLRSLPKSGSWMNSVKVVMGFLELAAAFKFVRAAELYLTTGPTQYFTYDMVIGIYIILAAACGLYLLGIYRLPHDHDAAQTIGVPRLLWAIGFLTLALYLTPALFKDDKGQSQKPQGTVYAWVSSSLLPEFTLDDASKGRLDLALKQNSKLVFVDFTGVNCPNCRLNENNIFTQAKVEEEFKNFACVTLFTDGERPGQVPNTRLAAEFRDEKLKNNALPYYVVIQPKGKTLRVLGAYEKGKIDNADEFVQFLKDARARAN